MAFREKSAWIALISMLAIYGYYFTVMLTEPPVGGALLGLFVRSVVLVVVIQIVLNIVAAITSPKDAKAPEDEREKLFALKGMRNAYFVAATGIVATIAAILLGKDTAALANGLFFTLVVADMARAVTQIVYYRRGA